MRPQRASVLVIVASIGLSIPAVAQSTTFHQGRITFTQGGKEATWQLSSGDLQNTGGQQSMTIATLQYTPDGKYQTSNAPRFQLVFGKMGDVVSIVTLAAVKGPAGDGTYRMSKAKCTLQLGHMASDGIDGVGSCTGQFEGATVTKLTFSAKP